MKFHLLYRLPALLVLLLLSGCTTFTDLPPGTVLEITSPVIEEEEVTVDPFEDVEPPIDYIIGPGDTLYVNVNGRPELSSPIPMSGGRLLGSRVDGRGMIRLPMVGSVEVAGLTVEQAQQRLQDAFSAYLREHWVVVEISEFRSQPVYLLGQFRNPGTYYLDRPYRLMQGLAMAGGMLETANLRSARLIRDDETLPVDIFELLNMGRSNLNVWLRPGDTLFVPDDRNQHVFVYGAVSKPGPVGMPNGILNLDQALAASGLGEMRGNVEYVRIIRSHSATRGQLLVVDLRQSQRGLAMPFPLQLGDVIYVPRSGVGNWNQAINEILPSLQAVSAILQPFVQIKFLRDD